MVITDRLQGTANENKGAPSDPRASGVRSGSLPSQTGAPRVTWGTPAPSPPRPPAHTARRAGPACPPRRAAASPERSRTTQGKARGTEPAASASPGSRGGPGKPSPRKGVSQTGTPVCEDMVMRASASDRQGRLQSRAWAWAKGPPAFSDHWNRGNSRAWPLGHRGHFT